jgi:peroxiredoxin
MAIQSTMRPLGSPAPAFELPDTDGRTVSLDDVAGPAGLLVRFLSNHCPYVKHVRAELARIGADYAGRGVGVVAIGANDITRYPEDGPEGMAAVAEEYGFQFPYLWDEDQQVARAYEAACTPDLFLFDADRRLYYRGQLDDSRPGNGRPVDGADLRAALDALLDGRPAPEPQVPSMGCSIKWRPGNEPVRGLPLL